MRDVSPTEIAKALDGDQPPWLLDVREPWEWSLVKIDRATLIPMNQVPDALEQIPSDQVIAVMCHHGGRSAQVGYYLEQQGFSQVLNVAGGIEAWATEVDATLARY